MGGMKPNQDISSEETVQTVHDDNSGKVKVVCRFRPMNELENEHGGSLDIRINQEKEVSISQVSPSPDPRFPMQASSNTTLLLTTCLIQRPSRPKFTKLQPSR